MNSSSLFRAAACVAATAFVVSCSSSKPPIESIDVVCKRKFDDAKKDYTKGRDPEAQTKLRDVTVSCAQFEYAEEAQYMLAQSHFRIEQWLEAETEFGILAGNWERTKYREEALWKVARSAWNQAPTWDRDPSLIQKAIEREESFLGEFPKGVRSDSARADMNDLVTRMANRRFETARLYMKMGEPQAATIYFHLLFKEYPDSDRLPLARLQLARAYSELEQFDRAQENLDSLQLDSLRAKPLSKDLQQARKDLDKSRRKFEARKAREAAESRQEKL